MASQQASIRDSSLTLGPSARQNQSAVTAGQGRGDGGDTRC